MTGSSDNAVPYSEEFDDVYFSKEDGLAETRHVFLEGNALPHAWRGLESFTIAETGFGTGLNFLAAAQLFLDTKQPDQSMHFISVEKFPLRADQIKNYLGHWKQEFSDIFDAYIAHYPLPLPGFHRLNFGADITLTLMFDDVSEAFRKIDTQVNTWFLDGFKPASNPEMWSDDVFAHMARLSAPNACFSTFTAAGFVKRGLVEVGFEVEKIPGFGRKREMLVGKYRGQQ